MSSIEEELYWDYFLTEAVKIVKSQKQQSNFGRIYRVVKAAHERGDSKFISPFFQDLPSQQAILNQLERAVKNYALLKTIAKGEVAYNIPWANTDRHLDLSSDQNDQSNIKMRKYLIKIVRELTKTPKGDVGVETIIPSARIENYIRYSTDINWPPGTVRNELDEWIFLNSLIEVNLKHLEDKLFTLYKAKFDYTACNDDDDDNPWLDYQNGNISVNTTFVTPAASPVHGVRSIFDTASPNTINKKLCKLFCPGVMKSPSGENVNGGENSENSAIVKEEVVMGNEIAEDQVHDHFSTWNNNETETTTTTCDSTNTITITKLSASETQTEINKLNAKERLPKTVLDDYLNKSRVEYESTDNDHELSISKPPSTTTITTGYDTVSEQNLLESAKSTKNATTNNGPTGNSENENNDLSSELTSTSANVQNNEVTTTTASNSVQQNIKRKESAKMSTLVQIDEQQPPLKKRKGPGRPPGSGKRKNVGKEKEILKKKDATGTGQVTHENMVVRLIEKRRCTKTDEISGNIVVPLQSTSFANSHSVSRAFEEPEKENECVGLKGKKRFNLGSLLIKDENFCDAQLILDDGEIFHVHKGVLGCQSLYFAKQFKDGKSFIDITDVSPIVLKSLLHFIYRGRFNPIDDLSLNALIEYFKFGVKFSIVRLAEYCKKKIYEARLEFDDLTADKGICLIEAATIESLKCDDGFLNDVLELIKPIYSQIKVEPKWKEMIADEKYCKMIQKLLFIVY